MKFSNKFIAVVTLLGLSAMAQARESVDEIKSANVSGFVKINVVRGNLVVKGWDRDEIQVVGKLDEQTKKFVFEVDGDEAVIDVKIPSNNRKWCVGYCNDASDLTVMVPTNSLLNVSVVSTEVNVSGVLGGLDIGGVSGEIVADNASKRIQISNVSGGVELRNAKGRIRLKSVSGDVEANDVHGPGEYHSVSGDIILREVSGELDLESVSGEIDVTQAEISILRGSTVSGNIELEFVPVPEVYIDLNTISGTVILAGDGKIAAKFNLETGSGSIRNRITDDKPKKSKYVRDETLRFSTGAGRVNVSTRSGNISVSE
ncbi:MAG: DUF4097 and DUF4098 domain-containing protein YvlB [Candidatus Azotimanducaceae bacterium]|jgi:DUF4097 and DUF4098 domain-containing protein YvlB